MKRNLALFLTVIIFIVFTLICYYLAFVTFISSVVFGTLISIIILNIMYPINKATTEEADYTIYIYAIFQIYAILLLLFYVSVTTLRNVRENAIDC